MARVIYYSILKYQPENRSLLDRLFDVVELADPRQDTDELLASADAIFAPLGFIVDEARLDRCPRLRAVISNTTSIYHIDEAAARRRNIEICALHDQPDFLDSITATAEHTIGLMIAALRRLPAAHEAASNGRWDRRPWGAPAMLSRCRVGIVGLGRLGTKVAAICRSMGMEVRFYDPGKPGSESSLIELARKADVLSLHAPGNEATRGLISREVLEALPKGAILVNTARGELLDLDTLLDLLESGHLYAAALDALSGEYDPGFGDTFADSRVARYARSHDNLILTPHIGGSTIDAWRETERRVIDLAAAALLDAPPPRELRPSTSA